MKIKFLNAVLLLAVTGAGCSTFTSCKDTDDDLRVEWSKSDADLKDKINLLTDQLNELKDAQTTCCNEVKDKIQDLLDWIRINEPKLEELADELEGKVNSTDLDGIINGVINNYDFTQIINQVIKQELNIDLEQLEAKLAEIATLASDVEKLQDDYSSINTLVTSLTSKYDDLDGKYSDLDAKYTQLLQDLADGKYAGLTKEEVEGMIDAAITTLSGDIKQVTDALEASIQSLKDNEIKDLQDKDQDFEARIATLETEIAKLSTIESKLSSIETRLGTVEQDALKAWNQAQSNLSAINALSALIGDTSGLGTLADEINKLKVKYNELFSKINSVNTELTQKLNALDSKIDGINTALGQKISDLTARVAANEEAIQALQEEVKKILKLENRLNALITGLLVQGTYNPLFGTFSLPIGVQSNMLVNYYGYSEKQDYTFPSVQSSATFNNENQITADELRMLQASNFTTFDVKNGAVLMDESDGNLGKVFVTINPNNIDFSGQKLPLVNSRDEESKVELRNLRPSTELLTFGYSRSDESNGFYEADATLPADMEAINQTAVRINDNLKTAMKDILRDKRNNLRSNLVGLMRAVYDQFNGLLPAYGLKAAWTVNDENYAVYSNYNIAATTFKPLSYSFLYDKSYGTPMPVIDPISEAIIEIDTDKFKFDFSGIEVDIDGEDATLDFSFSNVSLSYDKELKVTVTVKGDVKDLKGEVIGTTTSVATGGVSAQSITEMLKSIETQFNTQIGGWNSTIQTAYNESIQKIMGNVNSEFTTVLSQLEAKANESISDMIGDIQDEINNKVGSYISKFNNFIDRYNRLANRINNLFENPNHYLQPTMLYQAGSGLHFLSGNVERPTTVRRGSGNGLTLYATSYTGEIIAPAYKKFVACTNVIDNATNKSAQGGDAALLDELKAFNNVEYLAAVRPGTQRRFAINTDKMKVGHTYEILYTAVDYLGVTSTAHFYLTVAE